MLKFEWWAPMEGDWASQPDMIIVTQLIQSQTYLDRSLVVDGIWSVDISLPFFSSSGRMSMQTQKEEMISIPFTTLNDVGHHIIGFLDIPTSVKKKAVCCLWRALFTDTIE
jgi:hypothetical protein